MNAFTRKKSFCQEFDHEAAISPHLFWVIDHKKQRITHSLDMAAIIEICQNKGLDFKLVDLLEEGDDLSGGLQIGDPLTVEIYKNGKQDKTIEIVRQHEDILSDMAEDHEAEVPSCGACGDVGMLGPNQMCTCSGGLRL